MAEKDKHTISHSRCQRGELDPDAISIIFFAPDPKDIALVKVHEIELAKDGALKRAPKQFFQTYYLDSFTLAMGGDPHE